MSAPTAGTGDERRAAFLDLSADLRPTLHRYCARLLGSVIDGEDVVQDSMVRALEALPTLEPDTPLRPWLFRIAHHRAVDLLRSREVRRSEPLEAAHGLADASVPDHVEMLVREESVRLAVSRFAALPSMQRSVVILKDVLDESLAEIAALLDLSIDGVKGHLARGRARLREASAQPPGASTPRSPSAAVARYVSLFNGRDWDGLRALLAEDVRLHQSLHPVRVGAADVGTFFSIYATIEGVWLAPAWLEGREVIAVFEDRTALRPAYFMWIAWRDDGRIAFIRDYRYVRYVLDGAGLELS